MSLADEGRRAEALASLQRHRSRELGVRLSKVSNEWIAYDEEAATAAGNESIAGIERFQREMLVANSTAFLLTGLLGFLTFRRIVNPIQALEASVKAIAAGDYAKAVPFAECDGRNRRPGALDRRPQAGRRRDGRTALGQVQRLQAHGRAAGGGVACGVRATAAVGPRADAGRRRRGLLRVRREARASAARRRVRPCRTVRLRRLDPARRGAGRPVCAASERPSRSRISLRTTSASPPASARPRRSRPRRCRSCPRTRCSASSKSRPSARSTRRRSRCSTNCCRWWR